MLQQIEQGDVLCIFDFNTYEYSEYSLRPLSKKEENDIKESTQVWGYTSEKGSLCIGGINDEIANKVIINFNNQPDNEVRIIKRDTRYNKVNQIFLLLKQGKLGKNRHGNYVPYIKGRTTRVYKKDIIKLLNGK